LALVCAVLLVGCSAERDIQDSATGTGRGAWPVYAGDLQSTKYSPLDQIDAAGFASLEIAWSWVSADVAWLRDEYPKLEASKRSATMGNFTDRAPNLGNFQVTPLMIGGQLFGSTSMGQVFALDAATGRQQWLYDPTSYLDDKGSYYFGWSPKHRGVAAWSDGDDRRDPLGYAPAAGVGS
jgi:quinoprotein glucose dehydrogenase